MYTDCSKLILVRFFAPPHLQLFIVPNHFVSAHRDCCSRLPQHLSPGAAFRDGRLVALAPVSDLPLYRPSLAADLPPTLGAPAPVDRPGDQVLQGEAGEGGAAVLVRCMCNRRNGQSKLLKQPNNKAWRALRRGKEGRDACAKTRDSGRGYGWKSSSTTHIFFGGGQPRWRVLSYCCRWSKSVPQTRIYILNTPE